MIKMYKSAPKNSIEVKDSNQDTTKRLKKLEERVSTLTYELSQARNNTSVAQRKIRTQAVDINNILGSIARSNNISGSTSRNK